MNTAVFLILIAATLGAGWRSRDEYIRGRHWAGDVFAGLSILCAGLAGASLALGL